MDRPLVRAALTFFALFAMTAVVPLDAWDEVSHAYIVELAIPLVEDAELRALLSRHRALVRFGSWYPDWGQYGDHPFDAGSHGEVPAAYFRYVRREELRDRDDYEELVAHFMGAYSHIVGDNFLDSTIYRYLRELDNGVGGDMENGIMNIARHRYTGVRVDADYPYDHLVELYRDLGYFTRDSLSPADFRAQIDHHTRIQFLQMRGLKLLSFLGSSYVAHLMPWGAAHMHDAPGGHVDNAVAMAAVWDSLWDRMHGRPTQLFVHSLPPSGGTLPSPDNESRYGRITLVSALAIDPAKLSDDAVRLVRRDPQGGASGAADVAGTVTLYPYDEESGSYANLALQFVPAAPLAPGGRYELRVAGGEYGLYETAATEAFALPFTVAAAPDTSAPTPRFGLAMGFFLFALLGSGGGMLIGLRGVVFAGRARRGSGAPGAFARAALRAAQAAGVAVAGLGFVMLVLRGRPFIELLLDIF